MLSRLSGVRGELAGIADREKAGKESAEELGIERLLLAAKADSIHAAIELALGNVQPRHLVTARSLRHRAHAERGSINKALRPGAPGRAPRWDSRTQLRRTWLAIRAIPGRVTTRATVIPIAAVITAGVVIAAAITLRPASDPFAAGAPSPTATHEGQVAGGTPAISPPAGGPASPAPSTPRPLTFTFDELFAYAAPGPGWDLLRGSGLAEIAPFPDPFDRSLRLTHAGGSGPAVICREGLPDTDLVLIDLSADDWRGVSVEVRQGSNAAAITVDDSSHLLLEADGRTADLADRFVKTGWQRLAVFLDFARGSIEVDMEPRDGGAGVSGAISLPAAWQPTGQATAVCISGPSSLNEEIYIDNLIISASGVGG